MRKLFTTEDYKALSSEKQVQHTKTTLEDVYHSVGSIVSPFSQVKIRVRKDNVHPYGVKHRLHFFAHKANRHLEVEANRSKEVVLRVHFGR